LITVEPWPDKNNEAEIRTLFPDITAGKYDSADQRLFVRTLKQFGKPVFARWGHEMEYVSGRYPWAKTDYDGYISAYRHFV
jgi:beta-mannanase